MSCATALGPQTHEKWKFQTSPKYGLQALNMQIYGFKKGVINHDESSWTGFHDEDLGCLGSHFSEKHTTKEWQ